MFDFEQYLTMKQLTISVTVRPIPVLRHREELHEGKPPGSEALQGGDAVVVQTQLSEEDVVVQAGGLKDTA